MSHHFAPEFTVSPTGKEPVSKKLQRNNEKSSSAKRREMEQLDFDNKQLEWKLLQLRQAMSKEKEDRGRQGSIWKSGNARIESHSRNILGRTISGASSASNKQKKSPKSMSKTSPKSPTKVRILKDEPLNLPQRDSAAKDLIRKLNSVAPPAEEPRRVLESAGHLEHWIKFALDKDDPDIIDLQSNSQGNLALSTVKAINPAAIGVYFMKWGRKRLLIASEGVIRKPKTGWGDEIYYPYTVKSQSDMPMRPEPPLKNISNKPFITSPQPPKSPQKGGQLLRGSFNETENAALFQKALKDWRNGNSSNDNSPEKDIGGKDYTQSSVKAPPEMSEHVAQCTPEPFEVKFSETSTLSYMEKVLLQRHRQSEVPPLPRSLSDTVNDYLDPDFDKQGRNDETALTADEQKERQRYRQLFNPSQTQDHDQVIGGVIFEEVDSDDDIDGSDDFTIVVSPPTTPPPSVTRSDVTVRIEEVVYLSDTTINESAELRSASSVRESLINATSFHDQNLANKSLLSEHLQGENQKTYEASDFVREISKIPINPDAFYNKGLDVFFVENNQADKSSFESQFQNFEGDFTVTKVSENWNPLTSVPEGDNDLNNHHQCTPESNDPAQLEKHHYVDSDGTSYERHLFTKNGDCDVTSDSDDSADERALDDLEWELASQMGNITSDGRISRLIDDWPEERDLDIIDDSGSGSGLTTPDVNSNRQSRLSMAEENEAQMQYDFHNMEHMVMDDLNDEYIGDEV